MGASKPPTSPLVWIAGGCGVLVVLYLLLSCVLPLVMYGVMGLGGFGSGASAPAASVGTPYDLGPPSAGGPMLPPDPSEPPPADGGSAVGADDAGAPNALPTIPDGPHDES